MIVITSGGLKLGGAPLEVGRELSLDTATEDAFVATGKALFVNQNLPVVANARYYGSSLGDVSTEVVQTGKKIRSNRLAYATPVLLGNILAANFTITGVGATKADEYVTTGLSSSSIKIIGTTGASTATIEKNGLSIDLSNSDNFQVVWNTDDISKVSGISVIFCSDASGIVNYASVNALTASPVYGAKNIGWNFSAWMKSDMALAGSINWASIKMIRFQVTTTVGSPTVFFDSIWQNCKTRAKAVVVYDAAYTEAYDFNVGQGFYTYMSSKGLKGSVAVCGGLVGTTNYLNHSQLRAMYEGGFDVLTHGVGYNGVAGGYTSITSFPSEADAVTNVTLNKNFVDSMGWRGASNIYVWPTGAYTQTLIASLRDKGFIAGRTTHEAMAAAYFPDPDYLMRLPGVKLSAKTFVQVKPFIDRAITSGTTVILYGNRLQTAGGATGLFQNVTEWTKTVDYLAANKEFIDTETFSDWVSGIKPMGA